MIKLSDRVKLIMDRLDDNGFECYVVGGCVRDSLLGVEPKDWDLITDAMLPNLVDIFPECEVISEEYSVIRFEDLDVATYRRESNFESYGRPTDVTFVTNVKLDMERRDFTVNALAYNYKGDFIDFFGGKDDLDKRIIRVIGEPKVRFVEDPIRMMRAIRFAAEKGFDINNTAYYAIKELAPLLKEISTDRIRSEVEKILASDNVAHGWKMLSETGVLDILTSRDMLEKMNFSKMTKLHLLDGIHMMEELEEIKEIPQLKGFMYMLGRERFAFMQKLVDISIRVPAGEAVYADELAIGGAELKELGFEGVEIRQVIDELIYDVHRHPEYNEKEKLIELAKSYRV